MTADLADLNAKFKQAVGHRQLIESSAQNVRTLLEGASSDVYFRSKQRIDLPKLLSGSAGRQHVLRTSDNYIPSAVRKR